MKLFSTLLLTFFSLTVFAQSNYHAGYVVKSSGDTLKGFIDYRDWSFSPFSIDFKTNKDDKQPQSFDPGTINGFGVTGTEDYISYRGLVSNDRNRFPDLANMLDTTKVPAAIFLRRIASGGNVSLFSQSDTKKTRYFIAERNGVPVELKYNEYYNDQRDAVQRAFFHGQLIIYINKYNSGNKQLNEQAEQTKFDEQQLIKIVNEINGNTAVGAGILGSRQIIRVSLGAGLSLAQNEGIGYNIKTGVPQVNFGLDFLNNPDVQQFFVRTNFSLSLAGYKVPYPIQNALDNVLSVDQFTLSISPQFFFNVYNKDKFKVFVSAGAGFNLSSHSYTQTATDVDLSNNESNKVQFSTFWVNIPLQAGIAINKKWEAAFTYAPYTKLVPGGYSKFSYHSFGIAVQFYLDK